MTIDLLYAGRNTQEVVKTLPIGWLVSGPIRVCLHLANVWYTHGRKNLVIDGSAYRLNGVGIFGPNEPEHLFSTWAAQNDANYSWLYFYGRDMCDEYIRRLPHMVRHGVLTMLCTLEQIPDAIPEGEWTEPTFAANVELKQ
jgi:hypothetical protein